MMDPMWANLWRLSLATSLLGILAWGVAGGLQIHNAALPWFLLSGAVGFGVGDIGLFLAFARLGARLTLLIALCLAPLFAASGEWLILKTTISVAEFGAMLVVLLGVSLAITGQEPSQRRLPRSYPTGVCLAVLAGLGQGVGAVLSRLAESHAAPEAVTPFAQAFQRCAAGWFVLLIATLLWWQRWRGQRPVLRVSVRTFLPWLLGAATFGPVFGVSCFQWGLVLVQNSAFVQATVSTSPIALMVLTFVIDREVPSARSLIGALLGIAGVVLLCLIRQA